MTLSDEHSISFERGVFLALLVLCGLLAVRLVLNWPKAVELEPARIDYREPQRVDITLPELPAAAFAGRDILVPYELAQVRSTKITKAPENKPQPRPAVANRPPRREAAEVTLKPKAPKPTVIAQTPEKTPTPETGKKAVPMVIKGAVNFSGLGYRLLAVNPDGVYSRLGEGDSFMYNGEKFLLKKIEPNSAVVEMEDGTLTTLKFDFVFSGSGANADSGNSDAAMKKNTPQTAPKKSANPKKTGGVGSISNNAKNLEQTLKKLGVAGDLEKALSGSNRAVLEKLVKEHGKDVLRKALQP